MDSVYKLTKYSQKITDACQKKQYEKIGVYNKHENLYIKKLNEYFCNQKGGANMEEFKKFVVQMVVALNKVIIEKSDIIETMNRLADQNELLNAEIQKLNENLKRITDLPADQQAEQASVARIENLEREIRDKDEAMRQQEAKLVHTEQLMMNQAKIIQNLEKKTQQLLAITKEKDIAEAAVQQLASQKMAVDEQLAQLTQRNADTIAANDVLKAEKSSLDSQLSNLTLELQEATAKLGTSQVEAGAARSSAVRAAGAPGKTGEEAAAKLDGGARRR